MNIFLDTNVILEYFTIREEYATAQALFASFQGKEHSLFMSVGSFYTMIYLTDKVLKKETALRGEARLQALRDIMTRILRTISVAGHDGESLLRGISDAAFKDVEDGCQYEAASRAGCEVLITFNRSDFPVSDGRSPKVMTPREFLEE